MDVKILLAQFPFLEGLEYKDFIYSADSRFTLAATIVNANLPFKPGVYLVYDYTYKKLDSLLYIGKSGVDKYGKINTHQLPQRLLASINPSETYRNHPKMPKLRDVSRNLAWPIMMEVDKINSIKIFCFYSNIKNCTVDKNNIPLNIEKQICKIVKSIPKWAKK